MFFSFFEMIFEFSPKCQIHTKRLQCDHFKRQMRVNFEFMRRRLKSEAARIKTARNVFSEINETENRISSK